MPTSTAVGSATTISPIKNLVEELIKQRFNRQFAYQGDLPFIVIPSDDDRPRAIVTEELLRGEAKCYLVALTCTETLEGNRFAYQYSHELSHFWFHPVEHPFLEICAVAVSLQILSDCSTEWVLRGLAPGTYSAKFTHYRNLVENQAFQQLNLNKNDVPSAFASRNSPLTHSVIVGNEHICAGAIFADNILGKFKTWTPLTKLHRCVTYPDDENVHLYRVDFELWQKLCSSKEEHDFVTEVALMFDSLFSMKEQSSWRSYLQRYICCCATISRSRGVGEDVL
jgi:hypothetical protein